MMSTFDVMQWNSCNVSFFPCLIKGTLKFGNFDQHLQKHQMHLTWIANVVASMFEMCQP